MAFQFPLATVLRLRESIERREERALKKIQMEMARVSRQIEELDAAIARAQRERDGALREPMPASHLQAMLAQTALTIEGRKTLQAMLRGLEEQRLKQLKVYQAAHRDHEMLIEMRKQQRNAYLLEQERMEQKYLDDIFIARRHRS
ncbi:MAG: flagellar FliJ family protein [Acidobacteriaceae bacterium]|jgi:flagellar FliJ protein